MSSPREDRSAAASSRIHQSRIPINGWPRSMQSPVLLLCTMHVRTCAVLAFATSCLASSLKPPSQLFSPLIAQKILATAQNTTSLSSRVYPQYTTRDSGSWLWFVPDTWTSGFFPVTLYAMNDRAKLCPKSVANANGADWVDLGRAWSTAEIPLEVNTGVGHDVGFLSFPFVEELAV
jgi:hypothetical protein